MNGKVVFINPRNGFVVVQVAGDDYTVFEMIGGYDVEIGDIFSGNLHSPGDENLRNQTGDYR